MENVHDVNGGMCAFRWRSSCDTICDINLAPLLPFARRLILTASETLQRRFYDWMPLSSRYILSKLYLGPSEPNGTYTRAFNCILLDSMIKDRLYDTKYTSNLQSLMHSN